MDYGFALAASAHARQRSQQRGIAVPAVDLVLGHFDRVLHAGDGCQSVRISRETIEELRVSGVDRQLLERAGRIVVVMREDNWWIVTVMHDEGGDRRYRRQAATRKRNAR